MIGEDARRCDDPAMIYLLATLAVLLLAYAPTLWIRHVMRRHGAERTDLPGTGAELATHLLHRFELDDVKVERGKPNQDHYDPGARTIRLSPAHHDGRSLAAVAVAAHEVGHAIQFGRNEPVSRLRKRWLPVAMRLKQIGILILTLLPILVIVVRAPGALFALVGLSIALQLAGALAYAIILPEEFDASFGKALPVLADGEYVDDADLPAVRQVLKAAAFTYVAGALADLINIGRWAMILKR